MPRALFPAAPGAWHWSGTVTIQNYANNPYNYGNLSQGSASTGSRLTIQVGWAVDMDTGEARGDMPRNSKLALRLVRPYTPEAVSETASQAEPEASSKP